MANACGSCCVIGVEYKDACPVEPMIPVYLIVLGSTTLLILAMCIVSLACDSCDSDICKWCAGLLYLGLLLLFVAWIGAGTFWYVSAHPDRSGDPLRDNFCDYTLYAYFCSQVILSYLLLLILILGCCSACCAGGDESESSTAIDRRQSQSRAVSMMQKTQLAYLVVERIQVVQVQTVHT